MNDLDPAEALFTEVSSEKTRDSAYWWQSMPVTSRRRLIAGLNAATVMLLLAGMWSILATEGLVFGEYIMLAAYALTLPWLSIGLWNSLIGFALDRVFGDNAAQVVTPALSRVTGTEIITQRTAIVMALRNEDPEASIGRLRKLQREIARSRWHNKFSFHVLSDSDLPEIAEQEARLVGRWQEMAPECDIHYRRRTDNSGYKAGNIAEFVHRSVGRYTYFLPLDADSEMGADTVFRMVRVMQASPEIGMLQSLVTGLPSRTFFTRAFQFGMRHGMRSYTLGAAWWQADCGPNWGHNLLIRLQPFAEACMLPVLEGRGPLSGHIMSHDQVEAVLMRRAGFEVRVMAEESESREENPPSLIDFIRRELRWMNGNMQYLRLLNMPGLKPLSRVQLLLAIQMYVSAPAWMVFILAGAAMAGSDVQMASVPIWVGLSFFALLMTFTLMPKLMGLAQVLSRRDRAEAYGGRGRVALGGAAEILFSMVTSPIVAFSLTLFMAGLFLGRRIGWDAQQRDRRCLSWREAARVLWPQTAVGLALSAWLGAVAPWALWFAAPILFALVCAIPLAVVSTLPAISRWSISRGLFDIPEDQVGERIRRRMRFVANHI
ncbi:glucans biosynthesis glucosyltransferase MdoH [Roseovarius aestuariivivens]|uniref:glucans biosynthesis glucosyltransferase MdoH n=1 Tax=Roseovarius aestuariivivens TaxID=1888910 RepID=UPI001081E88A|nr:glucans biosynthesis glucosyltransferase MdoH [Roseovarius aestuariivivens]